MTLLIIIIGIVPASGQKSKRERYVIAMFCYISSHDNVARIYGRGLIGRLYHLGKQRYDDF